MLQRRVLPLAEAFAFESRYTFFQPNFLSKRNRGISGCISKGGTVKLTLELSLMVCCPKDINQARIC